MEGAGFAVPPIFYLLGFKPRMTEHLNAFTQEVMRGPSILPPGMRELIAAFTSRGNQCVF
jgi:alkylhydroperoxidase family enzyme